MALSTKAAWETFLKKAGIPQAETTDYAKTLVSNRIYDPADLSKEILKELGITVIGDQIAILKETKKNQTPTESTEQRNSVSIKAHVTLPRINSEMTPAEFRKFKADWSVYKNITKIPSSQMASQLYTACEDAVLGCMS